MRAKAKRVTPILSPTQAEHTHVTVELCKQKLAWQRTRLRRRQREKPTPVRTRSCSFRIGSLAVRAQLDLAVARCPALLKEAAEG